MKTNDCTERIARQTKLLTLLLLVLPAVVEAQFTFITNNGSITITGYSGTNSAVVIPSTTNGFPVAAIGTNAFYNNTNLTSVAIPDSVTNIGDSAFGVCPSLTNVTIPNRVISIGTASFGGCIGLESVTIGNSVTSI